MTLPLPNSVLLLRAVTKTARRPKLPVLAGIWLMAAATPEAATLTEDFATAPLARGWSVYGDTNLFYWNASSQNLEVTWDSAQSNSYFHLPLGTILGKSDDFSLAFDLRLNDVTVGVNPAKPSTFQLAVGLQNVVDATRTNFFRGNGHASPNLVEFAFFPGADIIDPTVWPSIWSTNAVLNYGGSSDYTLLNLPTGVVMRIILKYAGSNQTLSTTITTNGVSLAPINPVKLSATFKDFRVGTFAIPSYSDAGQDPEYGGSLLAHGIVDNISITLPPPPVQNLTGAFSGSTRQVQFLSQSNWVYALERSAGLQSWVATSALLAGNGTNLVLQDTNLPVGNVFYRVSAQRP